MADDARERLTLWDILSNSLVFEQTIPYLSISGLLNVAATCKAFYGLVYGTSGTFRHLDLSTAKGASVDIQPIDRGAETWRSQRMDEHLTEEDFYSGPLRGIFATLRRRDVLKHVQVLVLDGQSAPPEILHEIISEAQYNVQILSLINAKNFNEGKFRQILRYATRPDRPPGTPKLKGLYLFGKGSPDDCWYDGSHRMHATRMALDDWAPVLHACEGIIAFDAVLCRGPKHFMTFKDPEDREHREYVNPNIASVSIKGGCQVCHSIPEGPAMPADAPSTRLPLLTPPPRKAALIWRAQQPSDRFGAPRNVPLFTRCYACLVDRCCMKCYKFWCEDCFSKESGEGCLRRPPSTGTKRECWECGYMCESCNGASQSLCKHCGFTFCKFHNDGSTVSSLTFINRSQFELLTFSDGGV